MKYFLATLFIFSFFVASFSPVFAQTSVKFGIMSDSTSDEYRANDNRAGGTQWAATTLSWGELLVNKRNFSLGSWGTRSEPRRTGYEYNWARSGAMTNTLISSGQHTGMAAQVQAGLVDVVYIQIGNNDFAYYDSNFDGHKIYNGTLAGAALTAKINQMTNDIRTAVTTVKAAGPDHIILGNIPDPGDSPYNRGRYPDATKRAKVTAAITQVNNNITQIAQQNNAIHFDLATQGLKYLSRIDSTGNMTVGGVKISFLNNSNDPRSAILADNTHAGTVLEGLLANDVLAVLNTRLSTPITPFTELEILQNAGLAATTATPTPLPTATQTPTPRPTSTSTPRPSGTAQPESEVCRADVDQDGVVDITDYSLLVGEFLKSPPSIPRTDVDKDGLVDITDYSLLVGQFFGTCQR